MTIDQEIPKSKIIKPKIRFKIDKLIRDKQPEKMDKYGITYKIWTMTLDEYKDKLNDKIVEESLEVTEAKTKTELTAELSDVLEVLHAIAKINDIEFEKVEQMRLAKRKEKGGFDARIYNEYSETEEGSEAYNYLVKQPKKYPII